MDLHDYERQMLDKLAAIEQKIDQLALSDDAIISESESIRRELRQLKESLSSSRK